MKNILTATAVVLFISLAAIAQTRRPSARPAPKPKPTPGVQRVTALDTQPAVDKGKVSGRTYTNDTFNFALTFPDTWLIPDDDFEGYMKRQGVDLSLKPPRASTPQAQKLLDDAFRRLTVLLTVYKYLPGYDDNAVTRIAVEDLGAQPQIKDAVDYVDAVAAMYRASKMPAGFSFSETQAEQLGSHQFAFIDVTSPESRSRMYVTVRGRHAVLFKFSYSDEADLKTFRDVLANGDFSLK
jgi:hypothetical protein